MKTSLIILIGFLLTLPVHAQQKAGTFSNMEVNHIRVTTPGLFDKTKTILLYLDSLGQKDYCFPLPGGKVISPYGRGGGRHTGVDIKTRANDTIRSAFGGVVRMSKPYSATSSWCATPPAWRPSTATTPRTWCTVVTPSRPDRPLP